MQIRRRPPNPSIKVANLEYGIPHDDGEPRNILERIVWEKDKEVELKKQKVPLEKLKSKISTLPDPKDFLGALKKAKNLPAVIAEIKKASPSKGVIREDFDPVSIANAYQKGGASCISILTDREFFQGGFDILSKIRETVDIPILCKDFILTPYQIYEARSAGADAVLLIAAILSDQDLLYLRNVALKLNMTFIVEVHDSKEIERVLAIGSFPLIGINNRDLSDFQIDLNTTKNLAEKYESQLNNQNCLLISESGLFSRADLDNVLGYGAKAVLVGESLMKQDDVYSALKKLTGF
tara:strand:+ start:465 stop:1349 length:885 start_codon:yes stop_codon:yes gene_type:complete